MLDAKAPKKKPTPVWVKWAAMAACLTLVLGLVFTLLENSQHGGLIGNEGPAGSVAHSIKVNDEVYWPIGFKDRVFFGLVPEDAIGLTPENTYTISGNDIGDYIGTVEACGDTRLIGAELYHFTKYADSYDIVILKNGNEYEFYVSDRVSSSSPGNYPSEMRTGAD